MNNNVNCQRALLLSGGIDSLAMAAWQRPEYCVTINYGQKAAIAENRASAAICNHLGLKHISLEINCANLGSGDLAGTAALSLAPASDWWPFRNQMLITFAAMKVVSLNVNELMIGTVRTDAIHRDGTAEFFQHMHTLMRYQEGGLSVTAPALHLTSAELVRISGIESNILAYSHSCHTGNLACGRCRGCTKHREVMAELGFDVY